MRPQWQPGGRGAHLVLEEFVLRRLRDFGGNRAKTDVRSTSRVSPHVHYGEISTRHIHYAVRPRTAPGLHGGARTTSPRTAGLCVTPLGISLQRRTKRTAPAPPASVPASRGVCPPHVSR